MSNVNFMRFICIAKKHAPGIRLNPSLLAVDMPEEDCEKRSERSMQKALLVCVADPWLNAVPRCFAVARRGESLRLHELGVQLSHVCNDLRYSNERALQGRITRETLQAQRTLADDATLPSGQ